MPTISEMLAKRQGIGGLTQAGSSKPSVRKLQATINRQTGKLEYLGGETPGKKPGIFSNVTGRLFDILSRGQYASARGVSGMIQGAKKIGSGDILGGLAETLTAAPRGIVTGGIMGKDKSFSDVIAKDLGIKNKLVQGIGGFAGDVLLDPTTYLGAGIVKAAGKETIKAAGAKAAEQTIAKGLTHATTSKPVRDAISEAVKKKGSKLTSDEYDAVANAVKQTLSAGEAAKAADIAEQAARTAGKVEFKFMGKKIGQSERLFQAGQTVGRAAGGTELGGQLAKAFRPTAKFVGKTNIFKRRFENEGVAVYEDTVKKMRNGLPEVTDELGNVTPAQLGFKDLNKAEKRMITRARESGIPLTGKAEKSGIDLQDYVDEAARHLDGIGVEEVNEGIRHADDLKKFGDIDKGESTYVYHYYRKGKNTDAFKDFKKRRAAGEKLTIDDAIAAGLDPVEEIDDLIALRYADRYNIKSQKSFLDAVVAEYGVKATSHADEQLYKGRGLKNIKGHEFLDESVYLPEEVAGTIKHVRDLHSSPEQANAFLKHFDRVQAAWKTGATVVNPGHHVRNLIGDTYMNWLDGVSNPRRYKQAMSLMRNRKNADVISKMKFKVGDQTFRGDQILNMYEEFGAKSGFYRTEFGQGGLGVEKLRAFSEGREDFGRLAHFVDSLAKEGKDAKGLLAAREAADRAAQRVRKWNIDYGDLTEWEKKYGKRAIPFYTWLRKNIPLQIEAMALRPGRIAPIPKAERALERVLGTDDPEGSGIGEVIPAWLKEMSPIRLRGEGEGKNAWYWGVPLPFLDIGRMTEGGPKGTIKEIVSSLSPIARIPLEIAAEKNIYTGAPIKNIGEYIAQQLPIARQGMGLQSGTTDPMSAKLLNYLTGLGIHSISEKSQLGELRRQQDPIQQALREQLEKNKRK